MWPQGVLVALLTAGFCLRYHSAMVHEHEDMTGVGGCCGDIVLGRDALGRTEIGHRGGGGGGGHGGGGHGGGGRGFGRRWGGGRSRGLYGPDYIYPVALYLDDDDEDDDGDDEDDDE